MDFTQLAKVMGAYAGTSVMAWLASRYHLSGDQVMAITADLGMAGGVIVGAVFHKQALDAIPAGTKLVADVPKAPAAKTQS